jgi:arylformamidase
VADRQEERLVDLSHVIDAGMRTYKGLPGPVICDYWTRDASAELYEDGSSFQIGWIDMVANTGTYVDCPFHRFEDGTDLAGIALSAVAGLPGIRVAKPHRNGLAIDVADIAGLDVAGKAVLFQTGWDEHWRTDTYLHDHPFLTAEAAQALVAGGARLAGIDSHNIDDTRVRARPVHTILLGAGVLICEHMTGLGRVPDSGFRFFAVPPKISGMGTFPVRAFAEIVA